MEKIIAAQHEFFLQGKTLDVNYRINQLKILKNSIDNNYQELIDAFKKDFNKCEFDVVTTELSLVMRELDFFIKKIKKLAKPKKIKTSIINFPSKGYIHSEPYGTVLVVAPWNYPFQLAMIPVIGAMAAGNTVILKVSDNTKNVSKVIKDILSVFNKNYVYVTFNNKEERDVLFKQRYDYCFYTGSANVARILMQEQSKFLTPATLELGGKSPCIVDSDADLKIAAKRIVWGKFLNAGQTCVAPDYCLVQEDKIDEFLVLCKKQIEKFYYENGKLTENFPYLISEEKAIELENEVKNYEIITGGTRFGRLLEPTIVKGVKKDDKIMQEEIFGPVLPVLSYKNIDEVIGFIKSREKPLALYFFGKTNEQEVMKKCSFGGGDVNETVMHLTEEKLPFGGVGNSGMGNYHGKQTFVTFSHFKSVVKKSDKFEINLKYPPYTKKKLKIVKNMFKIRH